MPQKASDSDLARSEFRFVCHLESIGYESSVLGGYILLASSFVLKSTFKLGFWNEVGRNRLVRMTEKLRVKFCESRDWSNNHLLPFFKIAFEFCKIDKISLLFYIPISDGRRAFRTFEWTVGSSPGI